MEADDEKETRVVENPPSNEAANPPDPQETAYRDLHAERERLERDLTLAQQLQRFGADDSAVDAARRREESLLKELDRVLTMIRAAEVRRQAGPAARRWQ